MKKIRFLLSITAMAMMVLGISGCGAKETEDNTAAQAVEAEESQVADAEYAVDPASTKVAIICETVGAEQFLLQVVDAAKTASEEYGFDYSVMECAGDDDFLTNARAAVFEEYSLIIGVGWKSADAISTVAEEYPDSAEYALIDTTVENPNVSSFTFLMAEPCYVLGVLMASCFPDEETYGIVGSFQTQTTYEQRYGFMEGVKTVNEDAKFIQNFVGSYTDPATARELALQQMAQGCQVISSMCATANNEAIAKLATEQPGELYTSCQEVDLTTPDNPYLVSGMLKNTGVVARSIIDDFFNGTLEDGHQALGLASGANGVIHVTTESANYRSEYVTDEAIALAKEAADKIISGELVINVPQE